MSGLIRVGFVGLVNRSQPNTLLTKINSPAVQQLCHISGKSLKDPNSKTVKPKPFPYRTTNYGVFRAMMDKTTKRFDENSKIIVVEGPIGAGKTKFAKELAEELEMCYVPDANMDMFYINPYGYDMRQLDPDMPKKVKSFDVNNWLSNPKHENAAGLQLVLYKIRYEMYVNALAHLLSTGQGIVMDRCAYSDYVFLESMFASKFISPGARNAYYKVRENTIDFLMKPHLVIYLDIPPNVVKVQEFEFYH